MSALNLPKPVNTYAGEDELRQRPNGATGNGTTTVEDGEGDAEMEEVRPPRASDKLKVGIIYPPKEIRNIVDKTAIHISNSPKPLLLEEKIREHQKNDPKFAFLNDADPYHQYYRYMIVKAQEDAEDAKNGVVNATPVPEQKETKQEAINAYEPKAWEFKVDMPGVTAMDLDILRLTALFHARRGRSFLSSLWVKEGRNYQFDFLRPTHSLYGYYNRMVESYQKVMQPPPGLIEDLVKQANDPEIKWKTLAEARNRAEWEKGARKRENEKQKEEEEEAKAFAAIDWQDFVTVETIEFTQNDEALELPPPTSIEKLRSMSMAEKRMASMVMEETGAGPTGQDVDAEEMDMEEEEEEEVRLQRIKAEQEQARAREVQRAAMEQRGMKIKKDYVPKGIQRNNAVATAKCPYCGHSIPENELSEHIRIELLDPKWKEQKKVLEMRRAQAQQLQYGADVVGSLKNLASQRTDLFGDEIDEEERRRREEEAKQKRRDKEKIIWDGHTASAAKTTETFQTQFSLEDQIKKMHSRIGLTDAPVNGPGPQAGPGTSGQSIPTPLAAGLATPGGGTAYSGATIAAEPTGPTRKEYISAPYDPSLVPGLPAKPSTAISTTTTAASGTSTPSGAAPSIHPSRLAAMGGAPSAGAGAGASGSASPVASVAGQVRPHPGDGGAEGERPVFKRPKIEKLPYGQLYTEVDWMSLHPDPISISVQLPSMPEKPEWKLDGSIITIPDLPVKTLFSTVRERIKRIVDADLPISRLRLDYGAKVMNNASTLASVNLDDGEMLVLVVKKK